MKRLIIKKIKAMNEKIKSVKIEKLKVHPYHEKIYQANDIDELKESIEEVGLLEKIVVNTLLVIISGYRRYLALKALGYKTVEVEIKDINPDDELLHLISFNKQRNKTNREILNEVQYLKSIWGQKRGRKSSKDKIIQMNTPKVDTRKKIANKLNMSTGNLSKLEYINKKVPELIEDIDKGQMSINQAHTYLINKEKEDKVIKQDKKAPTTISKRDYKIYNKSSDDLSDLQDQSVQCIFTSPPYWKMRYFSDNERELGSEKTSEEFVQRLANHLHASYRVLKDDGSLFLNIGDTFVDKCLQLIPHRIANELIQKGWIVRNTIIWKKTSPMPSSIADKLTPSYDFIFHLVKSKKFYYNEILLPLDKQSKPKAIIARRKWRRNDPRSYANVCVTGLKDGKRMEDFWTQDIVTTATANQTAVKKYAGVGCHHPAPFPNEIVTLPILQTSKPGDIVMDLFSGSATTGEVALLLGRKYIGYELNPNHNDLQEARLDDAVETYNKYGQPSQVNQAA